jgi:hypothetical protein
VFRFSYFSFFACQFNFFFFLFYCWSQGGSGIVKIARGRQIFLSFLPLPPPPTHPPKKEIIIKFDQKHYLIVFLPSLTFCGSNVIRATPISRWNIKVEALKVELPHELEIEQ